MRSLKRIGIRFLVLTSFAVTVVIRSQTAQRKVFTADVNVTAYKPDGSIDRESSGRYKDAYLADGTHARLLYGKSGSPNSVEISDVSARKFTTISYTAQLGEFARLVWPTLIV